MRVKRRSLSEVEHAARRARNVVVLLLSVVAAATDVVSFKGLAGVLTANMTGNTVQLGLALSAGDWQTVALATLALLGYAAGVALGTLAVRNTAHHIWSPQITRALLLEWALLASLAALWFGYGPPADDSPLLWGLIALAAGAMGLQSGAARGFFADGLATTYVTGTITNAVARLVNNRYRPASWKQAQERKSSRPLLTVWVAYLAGATLAGAAVAYAGWIAVGFPVALLTLIIAFVMIRFR